MGNEVSKDHFEQEDYILFKQKLDEELAFIHHLFKKNQFDTQTRKLGYELELCLLDKDGAPAAVNNKILSKANNPLFTFELAKFNLEINGNPFKVDHRVFDYIETDLTSLYTEVTTVCKEFQIDPSLFGVLPSLEMKHMNSDLYMSDMDRYRLMDERLMEMRGRRIQLDINGDEHLQQRKSDLMFEALGTSLQIHYQTPFDETVDSYHASLWASMALAAATANSPLVFQKKCWHESRVAIFTQAVDTRSKQEIKDNIIPRVHLGKGYISSMFELFEDNVSYYSPILPEVIDVEVGKLHHFNLHNGTIWRWVRPILEQNSLGQYHLRLEIRVIPSGPTIIDTMANTVFSVGLIEGLKNSNIDLTAVPFETLDAGFYKASKKGLSAEVTWCNGTTDSIQNIILDFAIPVAKQGLQELKIDNPDKWLDIIQQRVKIGQTGSSWILDYWNKNQNALQLVKTYQSYAQENIPVHEWPKP